jgi:hypothetical protein
MKIRAIFTPLVCLTFGFSCVLMATPAPAAFVTIGAVELADPPPISVVQGATESNTTIIVFPELDNIVLDEDLAVDITTSGTFGTEAQLTPGVIPAGTRVSSRFLHFDPVGTPENPYAAFAAGSVVFTSDRPILGVMVLGPNLSASDAIVGLPGTTYPTGDGSRGLGLVMQDIINITPDQLSVTLAVAAGAGVDQVRVIVAVPEPSTVALLGLAAIGLIAGCRRRRS